MVYKEFLDEVRDDFETNLNTFLQSIGLDGVSKFCTDGFSVDKNNSSLAVYAFSPNGPVMEYDGMYQTVRFTVEFYLNDKDGDNASLEILEDSSTSIGVSSTGIGASSFCSSAEGVSSCSGLISSTISPLFASNSFFLMYFSSKN